MTSPIRIYRHRFTVPAEAVDANGHVNNVVYVGWMQDVAIQHSEASGGTAAMADSGATWVVRTHLVEYLRPAFAGDTIAVATWIANVRRVRSLRRYCFYRAGTGELLVKGETDWVFVDRDTGRPKAIPDTVAACFPLGPDSAEPDEPVE